jgi:periplasmic protein TonB
MQIAHAPPRPLSLDPKRIAATSAAIVVHVAVLMMLMMPAQVPPRKVVKDTPMIATPIEPIIPRTPPPPPDATRPRPVTTQTPLPPAPVQAAVENTEPRPVDIFVDRTTTEEVETTTFVEPATPSFAQIRADLAPPPTYPAQALQRRLTGLVMLRVLVDETGKPISVDVETSSGQRLLDDAAVKFVLKRWHFVPAMQDGRAVQAYALVPISFELQR